MVSATGSPCREGREGRVNLSLRLSAIPEEGSKVRRPCQFQSTQHLPHLPRAPPSPASYITAPPSPASFITVPLSPPPPSPIPQPSIPPPWDRTCDAGFSSAPRHNIHTQTKVWQQSVSTVYAISGHDRQPAPKSKQPRTLLQLPLAIRYQIYRHLVSAPTPELPIRLNALVFTRAVWSLDDFQSLAVALEPLQGALNTSFALRSEVLAALFGTRRFHVVFSPYARPAVCPLATLYLQRYGLLFRNITLELDCTRLGYGMHPAAAGLQPGLLSIGSLVALFVESHVTAASPENASQTDPLDNLTVLCRRYYGNRPVSSAGVEGTATSTTDVPYVGPEVEHVAEQLRSLAGLVASARFVGFSESFTLAMLTNLGEAENGHSDVHIWRRSPSDMYPLLPGHSAYVDCGPDLGICLSSQTALSPLICPSFGKSEDNDDDTKTISINDMSISTPISQSISPLSLSSSSPLASSTSLVLPLHVPSLQHVPPTTTALIDPHRAFPRLAMLPSLSSLRRGRKQGPALLTLFGFCQQQQQQQQQRPSSFVGVQLAAVGLAVGAVGSPLRLSRQDIGDKNIDGMSVDEKRRDGIDVGMDEKSKTVDEVVNVCLEKLCLGQNPSQQQQHHHQKEEGQHRPRRRLQKRRYDQEPSLVWSW